MPNKRAKPTAAKRKPTAKRKPAPPAVAVADDGAVFPYPHVGQGTSRVSDELAIWVLFEAEPTPAERAAIEAEVPASLMEHVRAGGVIEWERTLLHVDSGMDFKYAVASYDPGHLAWLDAKLATGGPLSADEIDRIARDVMNPTLDGPRSPKRTVWAAFDADLEVWLARVAARHRIRLVVKGVEVRPADETPWHRWSVATMIGKLEELLATLRGLPLPPPTSNKLGLVSPLLRECLRATPAKELSPATRELCVALLDVEGVVGDPAVLGKLVSALPPRDQAAYVQRLLAEHHAGALGLLHAKGTRKLLRDDGVYATALAHAAACRLPWWSWISGVDGVGRYVDKRDGDTVTWVRRLLALVDANGQLAASARAEADAGSSDETARSTHQHYLGYRRRAEL